MFRILDIPEYIMRWWRGRQRQIDINVLWPICKEQTPDLNRARAAFMLHCKYDIAWIDYSKEDLEDFIGQLK